jgi:hypothetical protein
MLLFERHQEWVAALIMGLVGGVGIATVWTFAPAKDIWDIATAIGTVGATIAAVGIAISGNNQRRREALQVANLVAARVGALAEQSIKFAVYASKWASFYEEPDPMRPVQRFSKFADNVQRAQLEIPLADLLALVPIPNRCAHRLARAASLLAVLHRDVSVAAGYFDISTYEYVVWSERRIELAKDWSQRLQDILVLLAVVKHECVKATHLSAPVPGVVEIIHINPERHAPVAE